jgi:hypothetical protein
MGSGSTAVASSAQQTAACSRFATLTLPGVPDVVMHDPELARLYVAIGDPGLVCSFDSDRLEQLETVTTEQGAHTIGWDPDGRSLYVFCPESGGALVLEERA